MSMNDQYTIVINPYLPDEVSWEVWGFDRPYAEQVRLSGGKVNVCSPGFEMRIRDAVAVNISRGDTQGAAWARAKRAVTLDDMVQMARAEAEGYVKRLTQYGAVYTYPSESDE